MKSIKVLSAALIAGTSADFVPFPEIPKDYKSPAKDGKCRALAMRGGGSKGAYEIGALKAMAEMMVAEEYAYDVVEGVSVGALNGGGLSLFPRGLEKMAINFMESVWLNNPINKMWS